MTVVSKCLEPLVIHSNLHFCPFKIKGILLSEINFLIVKALAPSLTVRPVLDPDEGPDCLFDSR